MRSGSSDDHRQSIIPGGPLVALMALLAALYVLWNGFRHVDRANYDPSPDTTAYRPSRDTRAPAAAAISVAWVTISMQDSTPAPVFLNSALRGHTTVELTTRPGDTALYEVRDSANRSVCSNRLALREFEHVCLVCRPREPKLARVQCK